VNLWCCLGNDVKYGVMDGKDSLIGGSSYCHAARSRSIQSFWTMMDYATSFHTMAEKSVFRQVSREDPESMSGRSHRIKACRGNDGFCDSTLFRAE